jgi:hypothetical protein
LDKPLRLVVCSLAVASHLAHVQLATGNRCNMHTTFNTPRAANEVLRKHAEQHAHNMQQAAGSVQRNTTRSACAAEQCGAAKSTTLHG